MQPVPIRTACRAATHSASNRPVTNWLLIGIRFALYVNLMLLFGLPMFGLYALRGAERVRSSVLPFRALMFWLAAAAIGLSILAIIAMTASMAGISLTEVDRASVDMMISQTAMGTAWQARIAALLTTFYLTIALGARKTATWLVLVSISSAAALASLAWTGHGAATTGDVGTAHLVADIVHLFAAGGWLGALAALIALLFRPLGQSTPDELHLLHRILHGFSPVGVIIVALITVSGLVNSWMLVGSDHLFSAVTTLYGQLLLVKLVLFATMLGLAALNRYRLTPAFDRAIEAGEAAKAVGALRKSLIFETSAALAILGLVAWLGTLEPPISM